MRKLVSYFEIPTVDFERAVNFYEVVLGVKLEIHTYCEGSQKGFFPKIEGKYQGAVSHSPNCIPLDNGVFISFQVDDMDTIVERVKSTGGTVIHPKMKIEENGFGYSSIFIDTEGNRIGLASDN